MMPTPYFCLPYPYSALNPYLHHPFSYSPVFFDQIRDNLFRTHDPTTYKTTVITLNEGPQPSPERINPQRRLGEPLKLSTSRVSIQGPSTNKNITLKKKASKTIKQTKPKNLEQKDGRNANSNLLRMFFRRLQYKVENQPEIILSIIQKHKLSICLEDFVDWISASKVDYRNYIRVSCIKKLFIGQAFIYEHTKVMRILLRIFLEKEAFPCYLTSKKAKRGVMNYNFASIRSIFREILNN